jgi:tRNA (adenine22-N1)-methyltransferase
MIRLSHRLETIANYISKGETVADIGTDHGFLPISLWERGISPKVILSDVKEGPLEKARANIQKYFPDNPFDIRLGSGLNTIGIGEVDAIVIAGMGGMLIADILAEDLEKTKSCQKIIMQPRNAQEKLRNWLLFNNFIIYDEVLVQEGKYICEIIAARPAGASGADGVNEESSSLNKKMNPLDLEISPILFDKKDPLLVEFLENKIRIENKIITDIKNGAGKNELKRKEALEASESRIQLLQELLKRSKREK